MSPSVTAMRCSVRRAGRTVASFIVLCLLLCRGDLNDIRNLIVGTGQATTQGVEAFAAE
jgi:hypothetical protein